MGAFDSRQALLERILTILSAEAKTDAPPAPDSDLIEDVDVDSVKIMDMVMEIEDSCNVEIPINALGDVRTPNDLATAIWKLVAEK